jgi:hypothetical protein
MRQKKTQFVRHWRSVLEFGSKEEKTLLTRPASLEIARQSRVTLPEQFAVWRLDSRAQLGELTLAMIKQL